MDKLDLRGVTLEELQEFLEAHGEPKFRASQIFEWLYSRRIQNRVEKLQGMANLSKACIEKLQPITYITSLILQEEVDSRYIFIAQDHNSLHSLLKNGRLFLATQIGCGYKCKFCLYGRMGLVRDLTSGEIVDQVVKVQAENQAVNPVRNNPAKRDADAQAPLETDQNYLTYSTGNEKFLTGQAHRISNGVNEIALGGMGEPLANYDNVLNAIRIINTRCGLGFPFKNTYLYTCGAASRIVEFGDTRLPIRLIVGLHSVDDKTRSSLMNVNDEYNVDTLLSAVKYYGHKTGITVELEYMLFEGVNDSYQDAKLLIKKLLGLPVKLVLTIYEPVSRVRLKPVNEARQEEFLKTLLVGNIKAEIR